METTIKKIDPALIEQVIDKYGLFWAVQKEELYLPDATKTQYFANVRQDNRKVFGVCSEQYEVFQNWELAELVLRVAEESSLEVSRGGQFGDGARVYIQIGHPDFELGTDRIKRWSTGINSFDGSTALKWAETNRTISCQNSFWAVYKKLNNSVRHTKNMRQMIDQSLRVLENMEEESKTLFEKFVKMTETGTSKEQVQQVIEKVTGVDPKKTVKEAETLYSTRKINIAQQLMGSISAEMASKGETLWGLWSGVTHYTTHKAGSEKKRDESKAVGHLQRVDQTVFEMLTSALA